MGTKMLKMGELCDMWCLSNCKVNNGDEDVEDGRAV